MLHMRSKAEMLRGSCLTQEKKGVYEPKTKESEKAGSRWESNPGHLWLVMCN